MANEQKPKNNRLDPYAERRWLFDHSISDGGGGGEDAANTKEVL